MVISLIKKLRNWLGSIFARELPYSVILKEEIPVNEYFQVISDTFDAIESKNIFRETPTISQPYRSII